MIYDQSGAGRNATTAVTTREYRIWSGTAITTIGSCGKPFAFIDAEDRGYTFSIPTLTTTALSSARRFTGQRRGEQHAGRPVHEPARFVEHQH